MIEIRIVMEDSLLLPQWRKGIKRGAFWGIVHAGPSPEQLEAFHDHVAVITSLDGVATRIDYYHSREACEIAATG